MSRKSKIVFVCEECGYETPKWYGQCPSCKEWNTLSEILIDSNKNTTGSINNISKSNPHKLFEINGIDEMRYNTGIKELNRVLGGGLVKGSLVLLSGEPGIGKSTLLLQICQSFSENDTILYISGEESEYQLKLRAERLNVNNREISLLCETDMEYICSVITNQRPNIVIIDSIQTMNISEINSLSGSITQVRESTNMFAQLAKSLDISIILVGHVNKDGNIAGPKVLEHIVDAVLYFEGDRNFSYRILRTIKNRYGSTNEIGVFDMTDMGLKEVENPSEMLLSERAKNTSGSCVACLMEGSRPILAEVQSLVCTTGFGTPRRMANGIDYNRMAMLIAIIEKRAGFYLGNMDCYINVIGGLKIDEPASDLSVALAIISSIKDISIPTDLLFLGEIGLSGEIRSVSYCEKRIKEAEKLGFKRILIPSFNYQKLDLSKFKNIEINGINYITQALSYGFK